MVLSVIVLFISVIIMAVEASDYLIGAFSQYQLRYTGGTYETKFDALGGYAENANYNALQYSVVTDDDYKIQGVLQKLNDHSIKSLFYDQTWDHTNNRVGANALSFGNYMKIEAEYEYTETPGFSIDPLHGTDEDTWGLESFDFVTKHETGSVSGESPSYSYSNGYAWVCDATTNDSNGRALFHPRRRWIPTNLGTGGLVHPYPRMLSEDLRFLGVAFNDIRVYIRFAVKINSYSDSLAASFGLKLYNPPIPGSYTGYEPQPDSNHYVNIDLTPSGSYGTTIAHNDVGIGTDFYLNQVFEYYFVLSSIYGGLLTGNDNSAVRHFYHLSPEVEWLGNGKLEIDYIEIEDSVYRQADSVWATCLQNQITHLDSLDVNNNILFQFGMDEPYIGQIKSYNKVQNVLNSLTEPRKYFSAIWIKDHNIDMHNGERYNYHKRFIKEASPNIMMVDIYPLSDNGMTWNDDAVNSYQHRLDIFLHRNYFNLARNTIAENPDIELYYIPQIHGMIAYGAENWKLQMPPLSTIKVLKYMPLCYAADGIVDFALTSNPSANVEGCNWVTALTYEGIGNDKYNNLHVTPQVSAYDMITEANTKISKYGPIIKILDWHSASKIMDVGPVPLAGSYDVGGIDTVPLGPMLLDNVYVVSDSSLTPSPGYNGYVQVGCYTDHSNFPYMMLVNRRSVYKKEGLEAPPITTPISSVDLFFGNAAHQTIMFEPSSSGNNVFGTHVGFYDCFDDSVFTPDTLGVAVKIDAGDGRLLQMCSTLPSTVTSNSVVKNVAYLSGSITINAGANVTIQAGTITTVFPFTTIRVSSGATLNVSGEVTIADNVSFIVEDGGQISFNDAHCTWGQGSVIEVTGGTLSIDSSTFDSSSSATRWEGLRVASSNVVSIADATISNAEHHQVIDSNLLISNTRINIPGNSWGLLLKNSVTGLQTEINNTEPGRGFFGDSNLTSKGIHLSSMKNPVYISNVDFQNLYYGIFKSAIPNATDSVSECHFVNCDTGIRLYNNENSTDIQQCSFANTQTGKQGTGIQLVASSPTISTSNFTNLYRGILTEFALISGFGIESSVNESNFYNCEMGIESRSSNHRLKANYFNRNNSGIVNHAGSNLNLSYDANNVMMSHNGNIVFYDTLPYESTIQLFTGHNDFYQLTDNSTGISAIDFCFDTNYYNFPVTPDFKINASKNWFQDDQVTFNDQAYVDYVYVDVYDPSPSMPAPPPESDRLFMALGYESQELYELAGATYKAIIDEQLDEEQTYVTSAVDGLYRCTMMIPNPAWELTDYFDTKALQYAIDEPTLSAIFKDYLAKVLVLNKDFQSAVDLIQLRIDTPISEIDSLRAVLDLEIVLQLAAMEEDKRPLTTKYAQYQYPDIQVFDVMHSNNWDKYNRVLHQNDPETISVVAPIPQIQGNYPNPFNPSTTIAFSIPETGRVRVSVYNIKGQKVKDLINTEMTRGNHKLIWDGKDTNSRNVGSGIYFFKLESGGKTSIRKAMLMK